VCVVLDCAPLSAHRRTLSSARSPLSRCPYLVGAFNVGSTSAHRHWRLGERFTQEAHEQASLEMPPSWREKISASMACAIRAHDGGSFDGPAGYDGVDQPRNARVAAAYMPARPAVDRTAVFASAAMTSSRSLPSHEALRITPAVNAWDCRSCGRSAIYSTTPQT
jgi:hypothetical protein